MIKYPYPEQINNNKDILIYFAECYEQKSGNRLPRPYFGQMGGQIKRIRKKYDLSLEEMALLIFGVFNTEPKVQKIGYVVYFIDKLNEYKQLKQQWKKQQNNTIEIPEYHEVKTEKGENPLDEFLK